jgi:hypothetical protein
MGDRVTRIVTKQIYFLLSLTSAASVILMNISTALSEATIENQSIPGFKGPLPQSMWLSAKHAQEKSENTSPIQMDLILEEKKWSPLKPSEQFRQIPLKIRITNLSNSPILFPNYSPELFFNLALVGGNGGAILMSEFAADGSAARIGQAFPKYGQCPIILPQNSIEAEWTISLTWEQKNVWVTLGLDTLLATPWTFKVFKSGEYKVRADYLAKQSINMRICEKEHPEGLPKDFLVPQKSSSSVSKIDIVLN